MNYTIKDNNNINKFTKQWLNNKSSKSRTIILFVLLSGSLYHSLSLSSCQLFGHNLLVCPLTFGDYNNLLNIKFK